MTLIATDPSRGAERAVPAVLTPGDLAPAHIALADIALTELAPVDIALAESTPGDTALTELSPAEWTRREQAHQRRADALTAGWRARRATGEAHPVDDFLFTYYPYRPSLLRRWHPGAGIVLRETAGSDRHGWRWYRESVSGPAAPSVLLDPAAADDPPAPAAPAPAPAPAAPAPAPAAASAPGAPRASVVDARGFLEAKSSMVAFVERLLQQTAARPGQFGCFGLHEWAMVYRVKAGEVRHESLPLRLTVAQTDDVVERNRITCSHFDAFRFFTPEAVGSNELQPTRESQPELEQPGCLHAGMDVYKWAIKLGPLVPGELLLDCFELARDIRQLDMQASPYDVSSFGLAPVQIETADGKREYARQQRVFAGRSNALRHAVLAAIATARTAASQPA